jgi:ribosomal peptide maturation radical SAM protein 1
MAGREAGSGPRVLLVSMPCVHPMNTSLALALLGEILAREGIAADCLHGPLLYPRSRLWDSEDGVRFLISYAGLLFGAYLAEDVAAYRQPFLEFMCQDYLAEISLHGLRPQGPVQVPRERIARQIADEIGRAGECLDRCEQRAADPAYDIVGFSITFFTQLPASLALARRLKARNPSVRIVFGGAGCVAEQAEGIMRSFPVVDAVCYTEADELIGDLVRALRGQGDLAQVPGIVYRRPDGTIERTPEPPLLRDLDRLPLPNHDAYFAQYEASEWRDLLPVLFFETSRGCWWGQKHLCTFCGLSERELAFRSKSPDRLYEEIAALYRRYPEADYLHPTDDILDTRYFGTLLPRLARMVREPERPLRLFFEVKSNMRPEHLHLLAHAGVGAVQPGIESFSDEILHLMDKGATGLQQVQFIKWATQAGVQLIYNLLIRNPGESAAAYREMSRLIPHITHLPPPASLLVTELERFSPYFRRPTAFGITNIRPKAYHRLIFPMEGVDLAGIAYRFDYDHPLQTDDELIAAQREFVALVERWCREHRPWQLYCQERGDHLVITDTRGGSTRRLVLGGLQAELYRYLDRHRAFAALRRRFPRLDEAILRAKLQEWHKRGLIYSSPGDEHLALAPQKYDRPPTLEEVLAMHAAPGEPARHLIRSRPASIC